MIIYSLFKKLFSGKVLTFLDYKKARKNKEIEDIPLWSPILFQHDHHITTWIKFKLSKQEEFYDDHITTRYDYYGY